MCAMEFHNITLRVKVFLDIQEYYVGRAMRKRVFGHMRTMKGQIRLHNQGLHCQLTE